jgi:hypothetical protein
MLLFHKRTKKAIKYIWGFISVLIVLSMVIVYSGFTMLVNTPDTTQTPSELPQEILDQMNAQGVTSPEIPLTTTPGTTSAPNTPPTPPVQKLDFSL